MSAFEPETRGDTDEIDEWSASPHTKAMKGCVLPIWRCLTVMLTRWQDRLARNRKKQHPVHTCESKHFLTLYCPSGHYIMMKVFSLLSLGRNLVNFIRTRKSKPFITSYGYLCPSGISHTGVGCCLFVQGFTRAPTQINEMLHTFLFTKHHSWSRVGLSCRYEK